MRRLILTTCLILASIVGGDLQSAGAHPVAGYEWTDNDVIGQYVGVRYGNIVGFWQGILQVDGFMGTCGPDGDFGPTTENQTYSWQLYENLGAADGVTGPESWGHAFQFVYYTGYGDDYAYNGYNVILPLVWPAAGASVWAWRPVINASYVYSIPDHPDINFERC